MPLSCKEPILFNRGQIIKSKINRDKVVYDNSDPSLNDIIPIEDSISEFFPTGQVIRDQMWPIHTEQAMLFNSNRNLILK